MIKRYSTEDCISGYFRHLVELYDYERYPDLQIVYKFILRHEGKEYISILKIENKKALWRDGESGETVDTIIDSPLSVWLDISCGNLSGVAALLRRKYHVSGNKKYLRNFKAIFGRKLNDKDVYGISDSKHTYEERTLRKWTKPDSILVINSSPRRENGYTYFYLNSFLEGVRKAGVKTEVIDIYDNKLKIEHCLGCYNCWKNQDGKCLIKDNAEELISKIASSYLTIYAFPLFVNSFPSKLKALFDRQFANLLPVFSDYNGLTRHPLRKHAEGYNALFSVCGFPEKEHFAPMVETMKAISVNMHKPLIASLLLPSSQFLAEAVPYRSYLEDLLRLLESGGTELVLTGSINKKTLQKIDKCHNIKTSEWRNFSNLYWKLKKES